MSKPPEIVELNAYVSSILGFLENLANWSTFEGPIHGIYQFIEDTPLPQIFKCKLLQKQYLRDIFYLKGKMMHFFHKVSSSLASDETPFEKVESYFIIAPIFPILYITFDIPNLLNEFVHEYLENLNKMPTEKDLEEVISMLPVKTGPGATKKTRITFGQEEHLSPCPYRQKQFIDERAATKSSRRRYSRSVRQKQDPGWNISLGSSTCYHET